MTSPKAVEKLSFEDALEELETIVRNLETGESPLEDSIAAYERGTALKRHCEEKLRDAQVKIEKISISNDKITTQPLDPEE
jgi:exodeoxyribonuclease VII small subunit